MLSWLQKIDIFYTSDGKKRNSDSEFEGKLTKLKIVKGGVVRA